MERRKIKIPATGIDPLVQEGWMMLSRETDFPELDLLERLDSQLRNLFDIKLVLGEREDVEEDRVLWVKPESAIETVDIVPREELILLVRDKITRDGISTDNLYVQTALDCGWAPRLIGLWDIYLELRQNADKAAGFLPRGLSRRDIEMPDDLEKALKIINESFRCIEYAAERWLRDNYPRKHSELFDKVSGSFFRPIKEFKA